MKAFTAQWCSMYVYMWGMNGLFVHYEVVYTLSKWYLLSGVITQARPWVEQP